MSSDPDEMRALLRDMLKYDFITPELAAELGRPVSMSRVRVVALARNVGIATRFEEGLEPKIINSDPEVAARLIHQANTWEQGLEELISENAVAEREDAERSAKYVRVGCALLLGLALLGLIRIIFFGDNADENSDTSTGYQQCESQLKPKLQECLRVQPEQSWGLCKAAYEGSLKECLH